LGRARWCTVGMQPSAEAEGKSVGEGALVHGWDAALGRGGGEIRWGGRAGARLGCSPRPRPRGNPLQKARGARLGCSPRPRPRGNPLGRARRGTVGMQPSAKAEGKSVGEGAPGHSWDAALGQGRGEIRWGGRRGTVGMQPSAKAEGRPVKPGTARFRGLRPFRSRLGTRRRAPRFSVVLTIRKRIAADFHRSLTNLVRDARVGSGLIRSGIHASCSS
jgi:hypothetical protein